jgi:large subunit ribosomal protein L5e
MPLHAPCPSVALPPVHPAQVHSKIRAEPVKPKKKPNKPAAPKQWLPRKLTYEQRKASLKARLNALAEADDE